MVNTPAFRPGEGTLPQNIEAEQAVLGSLLIDKRAIERIASFLRPEDFYLPVNSELYRAMLVLYERDRPTDVLTLADHLQAHERLDEMGGLAYLTSLTTIVPTSLNVEYYARIVERLGVLRRLIEAGSRISAVGYDERREADQALEEAERILFEVSRLRVTRDFVPLANILADVYEKIDHIHTHESEITGITSGFIDLNRITGGLQRSDLIILAARPSMGKCLTARSLIDDPSTGERLTIEEFVQQKRAIVLGLSEDGLIRPARVSAWVDSGVKPCFRVMTRLGRVVETTAHHPFLTVHGWVPLHDLTPGDRIGIPRAIPTFGSDRTCPRDLVRLLAYFIAEGGLTGTCPHFTNLDDDLVRDFRAIVGRQFPDCRIHCDRITYPVSSADWRGKGPNPVTTWLRELGLWGKHAEEKTFPTIVWMWPEDILAEFLRTLFSCDGTIYGMQGYPRIEFTVSSPQLASDVQHALTRFGIISKLWRKTARSWRVEITQPDAVDAYQSKIGWAGEKRLRFAEQPGGRRSNTGHVPREVWPAVRLAASSAGLTLIELARRSGEIPVEQRGKYSGYNPHTGRSLPRHRLAHYATVLEDPALTLLASGDIYWDEITEIEPIGEQQVYDLTVRDGANFVAQDVFVHNTSLALNIAHSVAVKANLPVGIFSVEMSSEQIAQRLISMEAQVETQRLRSGRMSDMDWDRLVASVGVLSEAPIFVDDSPGLSIVEMRSKARRLHTEQGLGLIVVDYLQLMQGASTDSRVQEISAISRGLKAVARELDVPVLALSQLSRAPEQRPNHEPMLSDLRESGCLTGDTLIYLPDEGTYQRIDSLIGRTGFRVLSLRERTWKLETRAAQRAFSTGRKPVFRLTTRLGRTIRATANHKFLAVDGWKRLDELDLAARIALPRRLEGPAHPTMSMDELALLGHMIGDGCALPHHTIQYTTRDADLAQIVADLAKRVFGGALAPRISAERGWMQVYLPSSRPLTHGVHNPIASWLGDLGVFGLRSYEKRVPDTVFRQPSTAIAKFLRHLWATDGCVNVSQGKKRYAALYYATSSLQLARDVQSLLLRLNINARCALVPQGSKGRDQYHVVVSGGPDIRHFLTHMGVLGARKDAHRVAIESFLEGSVANTNRDVIPREVWRLHAVPAMQSAGITGREMQKKLGNAYCGTALYKQNLGRERAVRLAGVVESPDLRALAESDVYWDEIVAIEPDGDEDVYDLTVEECHNFVADNIIVHNSIEQDADLVMFIYRDVVYNKETERPHVADLIVAKHRNGPTGKVHLFFQDSLMKFLDLSVHDDG